MSELQIAIAFVPIIIDNVINTMLILVVCINRVNTMLYLPSHGQHLPKKWCFKYHASETVVGLE